MTEPPGATGRGGGRRFTPKHAAAAAVLLVAAAALALVWRASTNATSSGAFCTSSCHTDAAGYHTKGAHMGTACQGCHAAGADLKLWWAQKTGKKPPAHGKLHDADCARCHNDLDDTRWRLTVATEGHRSHSPEQTKTGCVDCHRGEEHAGKQASTGCVRCHEGVELHQMAKDKAGDADRCVGCHEFIASEGERNAGKVICGKCHEKPQKRPNGTLTLAVAEASLHGKVGCKLCHSPHGDGKAKGQACKTCHSLKDSGKVKGHQKCDGCHKPHAPKVEAARQCGDCHEEARPVGLAADSTALKHVKDGCRGCHEPHRWSPKPDGCNKCHEQKVALVAQKSEKGHKRCQNCHEPHKPLPGAQVCASCHADKSFHLGSAPAGHARCTGCHEPHTASKAACTGCHQNQAAQVRAGPADHQKGCLGCHQNHGNPRPSSTICARCHGQKVNLVASAGPAPHKRCASCHQPHVFKITSAVAACSRCHEAVAKSPGGHGGNCEKCHTPHGSPAVAQSACARCHAKVKPAVMAKTKHNDCKTCHAPHTSKSAALGGCAGCHKDKAAVAASWSGGPHTGDCLKCHDNHNVRSTPSCGSCHKKPASQVSGKHTCVGCHAPHARPGGWWKRCGSCHKVQQAAATRRTGTHGQCSNCHKPHGFQRPACTSCHAPITKRAAHAVPEHNQRCTACHDSHARSRIGRKQCLACHKDKDNHQPGAQQCQACHPF